MSTSSWRSAMVTSPEPPSATVNSPSGERIVPIGVITAAVPQANASRGRPAGGPPGDALRAPAAPRPLPPPVDAARPLLDRAAGPLRQLEDRVPGDAGQD